MNDDLLFKQDGDKQVVDTDFLDLYIKMAEEEKSKPKDYELSDIINEAKNYPDAPDMSVSNIIAEVKSTDIPKDNSEFDLESILKEFKSSKEEKDDDEYAKKFILWVPKDTPKEKKLNTKTPDEIEYLEDVQITNLEPEIEQKIIDEDAVYQELMSIFQKKEPEAIKDDKDYGKNALLKLLDHGIILTQLLEQD